MVGDALFDLPPMPEAKPEMSATQRLTVRNQRSLAAGIHPATRAPLRPEGGKCGDCIHHRAYGHNLRTYHKCELHRLGTSSSASSDIRVGWPACVLFEAS